MPNRTNGRRLTSQTPEVPSGEVHRARTDLLSHEAWLAYAIEAARKSGHSVDFWLTKLEAIVQPLQEQLLLREAGK
jgi:hypothetical protein